MLKILLHFLLYSLPRFVLYWLQKFYRLVRVTSILQIYIYKELIASFFLVLSILTLIFFLVATMQFVGKYGQYLSFLDFFSLIPYVMVKVVSFTIPLAMLAATTLLYGRMSHDREILIVRTAGIHAREIFRPAFTIGIFLSFVSLFLNHEMVPYAYIKQEELKYGAIEVLLNANFSSQGASIDFIPNVRISYRELKNGQFQGLILQHILADDKNPNAQTPQVAQEILAESGTVTYNRRSKVLTFSFENCSLCNISPATSAGQPASEERFFFRQLNLPIPLDSESKAVNYERIKYKQYSALMEGIVFWEKEFNRLNQELKNAPQDMETTKLKELKETHLKTKDKYYSHLVMWHTRTAISFAPWLVVFLGASLGLLVQHSNRLVAFAVSALPVILIYYPIEMLGQFLADALIVAPWVGGWMGTFTTGIIGIVLLWYTYRR